MRLTLNYKKADGSLADWVLTAGQDKDEDVYLYTNVKSTVYKIARATLNSVRVPEEYFRDGKKPFRFPLEQAREIELHQGKFNPTVKKADSSWKLEGVAADKFELDMNKLTTLLQNLNGLEAQEYMPARAAKNIKADQRVVVRGEGGQTLLDLSWGDEFKSKLPYNKGQTFRFVKSNMEKDVMGVNAKKIAQLIDPTMLKAKAPPPAPPAAPQTEKK